MQIFEKRHRSQVLAYNSLLLNGILSNLVECNKTYFAVNDGIGKLRQNGGAEHEASNDLDKM